jgi:hypothetical protein
MRNAGSSRRFLVRELLLLLPAAANTHQAQQRDAEKAEHSRFGGYRDRRASFGAQFAYTRNTWLLEIQESAICRHRDLDFCHDVATVRNDL